MFSSAPNIIMLVVLKDGPLKTADDLKGRKVSVSTAGSLTFWLTQQLSRRLGWGDDGIAITPLGASDAQIAALMTHQIDGVTTDSVTVYKFVETGNGRVLLKYGDYFKDFVSSCIYASDNLIQSKPDALRAFLAGWFETIVYMRDHRQASIDITIKQIGVSPGVAAAIYDDTMPVMSSRRPFRPEGARLAGDFVRRHALLPDKARHVQALHGSVLAKMTAGDVAVRIRNVSHQFGEAGDAQYVRALDRHLARRRPRRASVPDRPERMRQEHAAQRHRRPAGADQRHRGRRRHAGARPAAARHRLRVPGECAVSRGTR